MSMLVGIHGSLKVVRCTECDFSLKVDKPHDIPFLLSLPRANDQSPPTALCDLPHCPKCASLLRPGVVWFGERLVDGAPDRIDDWISEESIDLVITAGTSLEVFPAAEWIHTARACGASLAIIDAEKNHQLADDPNENDWFFEGDIAVILPRILSLLKP
jgi:NAD-dependent deacetylase sirtuin 5